MILPSLLAVRGFLTKAWPFILAAGCIILLIVVYRAGGSAEEAENERDQAKASVEALEQKGAADTNAAAARTQSAVRLETERAELQEAVTDAQVQGRDPRAAFYECVRLQQAARKAGRPAPPCG